MCQVKIAFAENCWNFVISFYGEGEARRVRFLTGFVKSYKRTLEAKQKMLIKSEKSKFFISFAMLFFSRLKWSFVEFSADDCH